MLQQLSVPATLLYAIAAAAALVYFPFLVVAFGRFQVGYDAAIPRALFDKLPDYAKRATWAHQNSFESFSLFAAAALMAYVTRVSDPLAVQVAIAYVVARFFFSVFYILNVPVLRSAMFAIGSTGIILLFGLSLKQVTLFN
jgi:uncharacterized MAPEG superfamily protein